jgi:dTDP-glucose 4,6-dehydratase
MSTILVTGSAGTLGRPLVVELRRRGHDVWGCELQHTDDDRVIRADVRSYRQLEEAFDAIGDVDYVYHLAAEFGRLNGEEHYDTLWGTNVIGTRHVLELQRRRPFRLIFASSSEIYGDLQDELLTESIPLRRAIVQHNDYALTKWVNEVQIMNFEQRFGSECMRLRIFNVYGPGEHYHRYRSVVCLFTYRALQDLPYTVYTGHSRPFIYIDDFISTLAEGCDAFRAGAVYNIGGTESTSVERMNEILLDYLGKSDDHVTYLPEEAHNVRSKRPDLSKAVRDFGHDPTVPLTEGIPLTVEWMRATYLSERSEAASSIGR